MRCARVIVLSLANPFYSSLVRTCDLALPLGFEIGIRKAEHLGYIATLTVAQLDAS
jgi:hypothetical protein